MATSLHVTSRHGFLFCQRKGEKGWGESGTCMDDTINIFFKIIILLMPCVCFASQPTDLR